MAKRTADDQLTSDNWEQDTDEKVCVLSVWMKLRPLKNMGQMCITHSRATH